MELQWLWQGGEPQSHVLSKRGRPELRRQMYMFAVRNVTADGLYRERYLNALAVNPQKKKILIAIARDAARMMFSIARNQRLYTSERPM